MPAWGVGLALGLHGDYAHLPEVRRHLAAAAAIHARAHRQRMQASQRTTQMH
jgi:hypothetical protein